MSGLQARGAAASDPDAEKREQRQIDDICFCSNYIRGRGNIMSDFRIQTCVMGMVSTNCYIVYRKGGKHAVIVDPADNGSLYSE